MVPGGAPLSVTLVSLYLVASGSPIAAVGLFAWGAIELFIVDKTLRPKLVGGPIRLPFLPTLFGLIGGVKTMGMVGLFVGPVLMALLVAIWREWLLTTEIIAAKELSQTAPSVHAPPAEGIPATARISSPQTATWTSADVQEISGQEHVVEAHQVRAEQSVPSSQRPLQKGAQFSA